MRFISLIDGMKALNEISVEHQRFNVTHKMSLR